MQVYRVRLLLLNGRKKDLYYTDFELASLEASRSVTRPATYHNAATSSALCRCTGVNGRLRPDNAGAIRVYHRNHGTCKVHYI